MIAVKKIISQVGKIHRFVLKKYVNFKRDLTHEAKKMVLRSHISHKIYCKNIVHKNFFVFLQFEAEKFIALYIL